MRGEPAAGGARTCSYDWLHTSPLAAQITTTVTADAALARDALRTDDWGCLAGPPAGDSSPTPSTPTSI